MSTTFFFYDLETSGFNAKRDRIMQFAGQRTDENLKPIGEPVNEYIALSSDTLPSPGAILVTGITPQKTLDEGLSEAQFLQLFHEQVVQPDTVFVGFNTVRFDDEFMRYLHYRNYYDPYEWHWQAGCSRWDLLDVVRMTRALRPDGMKWPVDSSGKPTNRLELLTAINNIDHADAHDALADVRASIAVAKLIHDNQPKLFEYLFSVRKKSDVANVVEQNQPFVYSSGKYPSEFEKTAIVVRVAAHPKKQGAIVFDLRHDPTPYIAMSPEQLAEMWKYNPDKSVPRLPAKTLQYNRCPAIAPLGVLDKASQNRLSIDYATINKHFKQLQAAPQFGEDLQKAIQILDKARQTELVAHEQFADEQLYDNFITDADKKPMQLVREADGKTLGSLDVKFKDSRLAAMLPLYKARNFPKSLSDSEKIVWENYRTKKITAALPAYFEQIQQLQKQPGISHNKQYLLEELVLYAQSIAPEAD